MALDSEVSHAPPTDKALSADDPFGLTYAIHTLHLQPPSVLVSRGDVSATVASASRSVNMTATPQRPGPNGSRVIRKHTIPRLGDGLTKIFKDPKSCEPLLNHDHVSDNSNVSNLQISRHDYTPSLSLTAGSNQSAALSSCARNTTKARARPVNGTGEGNDHAPMHHNRRHSGQVATDSSASTDNLNNCAVDGFVVYDSSSISDGDAMDDLNYPTSKKGVRLYTPHSTPPTNGDWPDHAALESPTRVNSCHMSSDSTVGCARKSRFAPQLADRLSDSIRSFMPASNRKSDPTFPLSEKGVHEYIQVDFPSKKTEDLPEISLRKTLAPDIDDSKKHLSGATLESHITHARPIFHSAISYPNLELNSGWPTKSWESELDSRYFPDAPSGYVVSAKQGVRETVPKHTFLQYASSYMDLDPNFSYNPEPDDMGNPGVLPQLNVVVPQHEAEEVYQAKIDMHLANDAAWGFHAPVHIFVDMSNIFIGFVDSWKISRGFPLQQYIKAPGFNFKIFDAILQRQRTFRKRVLAGSVASTAGDRSKLPRHFIQAEECGYEMNIFGRVQKLSPGRPRRGTKSPRFLELCSNGDVSGITSGDESTEDCTNTTKFRIKNGEQGVDENLHLNMLYSILDYDAPETMVLATGDAARAEFSAGFKVHVARALEKGWKVELITWRKTASSAWTDPGFLAQYEKQFRILYLDDFLEDLNADSNQVAF